MDNETFRDFRWQMRNRIKDFKGLKKFLPALDLTGSALGKVSEKFPMAVTPYFAGLIKRADYSDPVFAQVVPDIREMQSSSRVSPDPFDEEKQMPVKRLVQRYHDRALILVTSNCAGFCRHCFRKRISGNRWKDISKPELERICLFLRKHRHIKEIILSGGDPFTLSDQKIDWILSIIRNVPSVEIIRIGTRTPSFIPMRITKNLVDILKKYHPVWISTQFNHPAEITEEAKRAVDLLLCGGIPVMNQTVLLKGINDSSACMEKLCRALIRIRVKPYYLFQCDPASGTEHFHTSISNGIKIMEFLFRRLTGIGIPLYVVDLPHGAGKIPVIPGMK